MGQFCMKLLVLKSLVYFESLTVNFPVMQKVTLFEDFETFKRSTH